MGSNLKESKFKSLLDSELKENGFDYSAVLKDPSYSALISKTLIQKTSDGKTVYHWLDKGGCVMASATVPRGGGALPELGSVVRENRKNEYLNAYNQEKTVRLNLRFSKNSDADIIEFLQSLPGRSRQPLIRELIRQHLKERPEGSISGRKP